MKTARWAELFDVLFDQSIDGVFLAQLDEPIVWSATSDREALLDYTFEELRLVRVNDVVCRQLGLAREQLIGSTPSSRWSGARDEWRAHFAHLFDQGRVHHSVSVPASYCGPPEIEGDYACTYDEERRITGYLGVQRDVSETRRATEALAESQRRFELALSGGEIGLWDHDLVANVLYFDRRQLKRLGYPDQPLELPATWWETRIHPADLQTVIDAFRAHVVGGNPMYRVEYRVRTASGDWAWCQTTGKVTAFDGRGRPLRAVGTTVDITERRQLQQRLVLSERLAAVGRLATGVAHEINNPLSYIMLTLELLRRELATLDTGRVEHVRTLIDRASYGAERVRAVVRDLQSVTRAPDERLTLLDPNTVLERCLEITSHQLSHRARVERSYGTIPRVRGDEGRMVQLFVNLLVNAAQAIPEGAAGSHRVQVTTSTAPDGRARIEVADDGPGIPEDVIGRIFDPFFTTKQIGEGTGLGLAIAHGIVMAMGGEIEVDSTLGHGTRFRILLPAAAASQPVTAFPAPVGRIDGVLRVLVIDDEPIIGSLICEGLSKHVVVFESSARPALERLRGGERFDRILCDLMMPEITGMDFYEQLGEIDPALRDRVVFLTGGAFTDRAQAFLERSSTRRLHKPFDLNQLAEALGSG